MRNQKKWGKRTLSKMIISTLTMSLMVGMSYPVMAENQIVENDYELENASVLEEEIPYVEADSEDATQISEEEIGSEVEAQFSEEEIGSEKEEAQLSSGVQSLVNAFTEKGFTVTIEGSNVIVQGTKTATDNKFEKYYVPKGTHLIWDANYTLKNGKVCIIGSGTFEMKKGSSIKMTENVFWEALSLNVPKAIIAGTVIGIEDAIAIVNDDEDANVYIEEGAMLEAHGQGIAVNAKNIGKRICLVVNDGLLIGNYNAIYLGQNNQSVCIMKGGVVNTSNYAVVADYIFYYGGISQSEKAVMAGIKGIYYANPISDTFKLLDTSLKNTKDISKVWSAYKDDEISDYQYDEQNAFDRPVYIKLLNQFDLSEAKIEGSMQNGVSDLGNGYLKVMGYTGKLSLSLTGAKIGDYVFDPIQSEIDLNVEVVERYPVSVLGKQLNELNKDDVLGDGTGSISYNPQTNTLLIKNLDYVDEKMVDNFIECKEDITIQLEGENTIQIKSKDNRALYVGIDALKNLTLVGSGQLTLSNDGAGICCKNLTAQSIRLLNIYSKNNSCIISDNIILKNTKLQLEIGYNISKIILTDHINDVCPKFENVRFDESECTFIRIEQEDSDTLTYEYLKELVLTDHMYSEENCKGICQICAKKYEAGHQYGRVGKCSVCGEIDYIDNLSKADRYGLKYDVLDMSKDYTVSVIYRDNSVLFVDEKNVMIPEYIWLSGIDKPFRVVSIEHGAISGSKITTVNIPSTVTKIGKYAFTGASNLQEIVLGCASTLDTEDDELWGQATGVNDVIVRKENHKFVHYVSNQDVTCSKHGTETATCENCTASDTRVDENSPLLPHTFDEWQVTIAATTTNSGKKIRKCSRCQFEESVELEKLSEKVTEQSTEQSKEKLDTKLQKQTITVSKTVKKTVKLKASKLKKKKVTIKINAKAKTKLSYKVTKGNKKYITVSKKGVITVKKGCKKGTYKVTITAVANKKYASAKKVVTIKVN